MRRISLVVASLLGCVGAGDIEGDHRRADAGDDVGGGKADDTDPPGELEYANPVRTGCADPGILRHDGGWYMTCTGGSGGNSFPIYRSDDLASWTLEGWVFPAGSQPA